ncbi:unnamed protein product [Nesidiocoris tenuis]|uniref:C2H2-type domain-containing protein n=1 Tax=Nesidiocoris tenuis TaxID=355587 RepID=A0A6H5GZ66_9HEMI|nr:unnamed protein product [Nesidiocoris tenuis]
MSYPAIHGSDAEEWNPAEVAIELWNADQDAPDSAIGKNSGGRRSRGKNGYSSPSVRRSKSWKNDTENLIPAAELCDECNLHFSFMQVHMRVAHERLAEINCAFCGLPFDSNANLFSHLTCHEDRQLICCICRVSVNVSLGFQVVNGGTVSQLRKRISFNERTEIWQWELKVKSFGDLQEGVDIVPVNGESESKVSYRQCVKIDGRYHCPDETCSDNNHRGYGNETMIRNHIRRNHMVDEWTHCRICNIFFRCNFTFHRHEEEVKHVYSCSQCTTKTNTMARFLYHVRTTHYDETTSIDGKSMPKTRLNFIQDQELFSICIDPLTQQLERYTKVKPRHKPVFTVQGCQYFPRTESYGSKKLKNPRIPRIQAPRTEDDGLGRNLLSAALSDDSCQPDLLRTC